MRLAAEVRVYPVESASAQDGAGLRPDAADSCPGAVEHRAEMADERQMARPDELPLQGLRTQQGASLPVESDARFPVCWDYWVAASAAVEIWQAQEAGRTALPDAGHLLAE